MDNQDNNRIPNPGAGFINFTMSNGKKAGLSKAIKKIESNCDFIKQDDTLKKRIFDIYDKLK